ncbi:MAG: hypothetical protein RBU21_00210 [FCB group bacterium]|jgi:hypothetical protein|nr:hypothetical protein [FCB group bacterium]
MKRISTITKPRVLEATVRQGLFLGLLEMAMQYLWGELNEKGGKGDS